MFSWSDIWYSSAAKYFPGGHGVQAKSSEKRNQTLLIRYCIKSDAYFPADLEGGSSKTIDENRAVPRKKETERKAVYFSWIGQSN